MRGQGQMTYYCSDDDTTLRASSEDELVRKYREHVRAAHNADISEEQARLTVHAELQTTGQLMR
jgi:predicted small metal-binding protein